MIDTVRGLKREDVWDFENGFHWFTPLNRMHKLLAHYELYKMIVDLPGAIAEFGVFKGASLIRFATFRRLLETDHSRKIVGFDAFGGFPSEGLDSKADRDFVKRFSEDAGDGLAKGELAALLEAKGITNVELVAGNVLDTLPAYLEANPHLRLAALHLDMDVELPTRLAFDLLYDRIVPGGLVIIDNYATVAGETDATDAFLADKIADRGVALKKLPFTNIPTYFRKP